MSFKSQTEWLSHPSLTNNRFHSHRLCIFLCDKYCRFKNLIKVVPVILFGHNFVLLPVLFKNLPWFTVPHYIEGSYNYEYHILLNMHAPRQFLQIPTLVKGSSYQIFWPYGIHKQFYLWLTPAENLMTFDPTNTLHSDQGFFSPNLVAIMHFWGNLTFDLWWSHFKNMLLSLVAPSAIPMPGFSPIPRSTSNA